MGTLPDALPTDAGRHRLGVQDELFCIEGVARYRCTGGRTIVVEVQDQAPLRNVRLYLLGSVMGLILHQRGLLPLHANAVEIDDVAWLFLGPSGSGKSTLAAWFLDRGMKVIADDVAVIDLDPQPSVLPGVPRLRLWRDAVEVSGRKVETLQRSYAGDEDWEKYDLTITGSAARRTPIAGACLLEPGTASRLCPLDGVAAVEALMANTYRGSFLLGTGGERLHWQACVRLARTIPLFTWQRPWDLARTDQSASSLLDGLSRAAALRPRGASSG